jgi:aquaporin Z
MCPFAAAATGSGRPAGLGAVLVVEALMTAFFVYVILGSTKDDAPRGLRR